MNMLEALVACGLQLAQEVNRSKLLSASDTLCGYTLCQLEKL